jgi:branched-chain amino acid transport system ATP-binding protein
VIRIHELTVAFGGVKAIDSLDAELSDPVCGLIGPNGAGKTTLVNVLSGLVQPSAGRVEVERTALLPMKPLARVRFGVRRSFQTEQVVEDLSVWDNVQAVLDHVPHAHGEAGQQIARALAHVGLLDVATLLGHELNLYQRRMVEIAKSLVGKPKLLMLDEPGAGLTEQEAGALRRAIRAVPEFCGAQVLLIDHDVDLIAATCSQTLVLDFGRRIALGPTREVLDDPAVRAAYLGTA